MYAYVQDPLLSGNATVGVRFVWNSVLWRHEVGRNISNFFSAIK